MAKYLNVLFDGGIFMNEYNGIIEKRKFPRYEADLIINNLDFVPKEINGYQTRNISQKGIRITTKGGHLKKDKVIIIEFKLDNNDIKLKGRVAWYEELTPNLYDNGIEFLNPAPNIINKLMKFGLFIPETRNISESD